MNMLKKAVVIAAKSDSAGSLTAGAAQLAGSVVVISLGGDSCAVNAQMAYCILGNSCAPSAVKAIKRIIADEAPQLVLVEQSRDGRFIAAMIAAENGVSVLTDSEELSIGEDGAVCSKRVVYGGKAHKTEHCAADIAVAVVGSGVYRADAITPAAEIIEYNAEGMDGIDLISIEPKPQQRVDLGAARKVVGVGRGIGDQAALAKAEAFAQQLGAEMACTRPVAEESKLMPRERYVGVTGSTIKPELYLALGISGVIQHMAGVNSSGTIIAVNKDKNAPIFKQCDYGIVGDLQETIAAISEKLNK